MKIYVKSSEELVLAHPENDPDTYIYKGMEIMLPTWCRYDSDADKLAMLERLHEAYLNPPQYEIIPEEVDYDAIDREMKDAGFLKKERDEVIRLMELGHGFDSAYQTMLENLHRSSR